MWWRGKHVLLNGASGGVGSILLQLLAGAGALVSTRSSPQRFGPLQKLGAVACLDYRDSLNGTLWDALIDCHGGLIGAHLPTVVRRGGLYIPLSVPNEKIVPLFFSLVIAKLCLRIGSRFVLAVPSRRILTDLIKRTVSGTLVPVVDSIYPVENVAQAVMFSIGGHVMGKIVVKID